MTGWLRAVGRELRQPVCVLGLVGMWITVTLLLWLNGSSDWGTRWNELGAVVRSMTIVLGPACLMAGLWQGGRDRRDGVGELVASTRRPALARTSASIAALTAVGTVGVLLGWASAAWTMLIVPSFGTWAAVGYLAGVPATVFAYVALGFAVGRSVPWRVAAPLAGLVAYVVLGYFAFSSPGSEVLSGAGFLGGAQGLEFGVGRLVASVGLLTLLGLIAVGLAGRDRGPAASRRWAGLAAVGVTALVAAAPSAVAAAGEELVRPPAADQPLVCTTDGGPRVCVFEEDQHTLATAVAQARPVLARLEPVPGGATQALPYAIAYDRPDSSVLMVEPWGAEPFGTLADDNGPPRLVSPELYLSLANRCPDRIAFRGDYALESLGGTVLRPAGEDAGAFRAIAPPALVRRLDTSSEAQKTDFVGRLLRAAVDCDPAAQRAAVDALADLSTP